MLAWWNQLTLFQTIMVCIAAPATLIILVQMIFLLIGFGGDESMDAIDADGADSFDVVNDESFLSLGGIKIFSLRGALAFLSVGGWLAMALDYTLDTWLAGIIGLFGGALTAFLIALAFHYALKMQRSGNINYKKAVGHVGTVYMRIPAKRTGFGKINLTLQERYVEISAITDDGETINTGLPVKITGLEDSSTVIVERYNPKKGKDIIIDDEVKE